MVDVFPSHPPAQGSWEIRGTPPAPRPFAALKGRLRGFAPLHSPFFSSQLMAEGVTQGDYDG